MALPLYNLRESIQQSIILFPEFSTKHDYDKLKLETLICVASVSKYFFDAIHATTARHNNNVNIAVPLNEIAYRVTNDEYKLLWDRPYYRAIFNTMRFYLCEKGYTFLASTNNNDYDLQSNPLFDAITMEALGVASAQYKGLVKFVIDICPEAAASRSNLKDEVYPLYAANKTQNEDIIALVKQAFPDAANQ